MHVPHMQLHSQHILHSLRRCDALLRDGRRCRAWRAVGRKRCRNHGGLSTGPRVAHRTMGPAWAASAAAKAARRAQGLPWYHGDGRKRPPGAALAHKTRGRLEGMAQELEAALPVDVMTADPATLSAPDALGRAELSAIRQLIRIVELPVDEDDLKQMRLIADVALGTTRLSARVSESRLQARKTDVLEGLLARLAEEDAKGAQKAPPTIEHDPS